MRSALAPTRLTAEINVMSERVPGRGSVVRVLVAEDMRILRETLVALLSVEEDIEVVAQVADGPAILVATAATYMTAIPHSTVTKTAWASRDASVTSARVGAAPGPASFR
jgi:hypothetical protein